MKRSLLPSMLAALAVTACTPSPSWESGATDSPEVPIAPVSDDDDVTADGDDPVEDPAEDPTPSDEPSIEQCDNGVDDDQDSLTDCVDPECASTEHCAQSETRTTIRFEGYLWATHVADDVMVYEDTGEIDGGLWVRDETLADGVWTLNCQSRVQVTGLVVDIDGCSDCDVVFELVPTLPSEADGCGFGAEMPSLPQALGLHQATGGAVAVTGSETVNWVVLDGVVDWTGWTSPSEYHVDSAGAPVILAAP